MFWNGTKVAVNSAAIILRESVETNTAYEVPAKALSVVTALLVEDSPEDREVCKEVAEEAGLQVRTAATTEEALTTLEEFPIDIVLTDLRVPEMGGMALLRRIRSQWPHVSVIVLTQYGTIDTALEATRLGAADYVTKPFHIEDLRVKLERVAHSLLLDQENRILREQLRTRPGFGGLIGLSAKMQRVYRLIEKVSQHNYPVLILGESGTGKEIVASSIHFLGPRSQKPFMPVDCSALVPSLIESELFGYVKGAFTGAQHNKRGLLETAEEGTLFLDEIGDMPVDLQAKLLRALQEHEIKPVGSTARVPMRARIIAATNRDLETSIRNGTFRQDLYFRLNVVQIKIPPLRERKTDIPLLVNAFLEKFADPELPPRRLTEEALRCLMAYDWPGNVRELENAVERAVALGSGPNLQLNDLPSSLHYGSGTRPLEDDKLVPLDAMERRAIFRALQETGGDKVAAARMLGIGKTTLYRKLKHYESHPATATP
jgi:DNA-binding NtrC family response regulator